MLRLALVLWLIGVSVAQAQFMPVGVAAPRTGGGGVFAAPGSADCSSTYVLTNANKTATKPNQSASWTTCASKTTGVSSGKKYFEVTLTAHDVTTGTGWAFGFTGGTVSVNQQTGDNGSNTIGFQPDTPNLEAALFTRGWAGTDTFNASTCHQITVSTVFGLAIDFTDTAHIKVWCTVDGTNWNAGGTANPATGVGGFDSGASAIPVPLYPAFSGFAVGDVPDGATLNDGGSAFSFTMPSGYSKWCGC